MREQPTVLIIDDEPHILEFLSENLTNDDIKVYVAASLAQARSKLNAVEPDLLLLDINLPDGNGFDFCREVRSANPLDVRYDTNVPIIMLTARTEELDRVRGFSRGADDFVPKPFHYMELLARINAILQRVKAQGKKEVIHIDGLTIDTRTRLVTLNGTDIPLSAKEYLLLLTLAKNPTKVYDKKELLETVWGYRSAGATRTLDSHASRLRRKLRPLGKGTPYIGNVWGVGYSLTGGENAR